MNNDWSAEQKMQQFQIISAQFLEQKTTATEDREEKLTLTQIADKIIDRLDNEERRPQKASRDLSPVHLKDHQKMRQEIARLKKIWGESQINDAEYINSLSYLVEFHQHFFDRGGVLEKPDSTKGNK